MAEAWEALFRAQVTLALEFEREGDWSDLLPREYGVLYALAGAPAGLRPSELCDDVLLTQAGLKPHTVVRRGWVYTRGSRLDALAPPLLQVPGLRTIFTFQHILAADL